MVMQQDRLSAVQSTPSASTVTTSMRVRKRNGTLEPGRRQQNRQRGRQSNRRTTRRRSDDRVDPHNRRASRRRHHPGTRRTVDPHAAGLIVEEPNYSKLAARLLSTYIDKEVRNQNAPWFSESVSLGHKLGLISDEVFEFVSEPRPDLNAAIDSQRDRNFEFFGIRVVYDRYLLRHPETRKVSKPPVLLIARRCGLSNSPEEAISLYDLMASLAYLPSSPTLFNSGTRHPQMSSCYLLDSPEDSLEGIYKRYTDIAQLSKFGGRDRRCLAPSPFQGQSHRRHQRTVQRHRPLAQDP